MIEMLKKINHIGIVVKNIEEAISAYSKALGIDPESVTEIPDVRLKACVFRIGDMEIELLHYDNPKIPVVKSLLGDREGLNHICYEVEGLDGAIDRLVKMGFSLVDGFPRKGVHGRIAFFIPPHSREERIEIIEVEA